MGIDNRSLPLQEPLLVNNGVKAPSVIINKMCWCLLMWQFDQQSGLMLLIADKLPTQTVTQWHHMTDATKEAENRTQS